MWGLRLHTPRPPQFTAHDACRRLPRGHGGAAGNRAAPGLTEQRDGWTGWLQGSWNYGGLELRDLFAFHSLGSIYCRGMLCCDAAGNIAALGSRLLWSQVAQQGAGAARCPVQPCGKRHSGRQRALLQRGGRGCSTAVPIPLWIPTALGAMCTLVVIKPLPGSPNSSVAPPLCFTAMPKGERSHQGQTVTPSPRLFSAMTLVSHSQCWSQL